MHYYFDADVAKAIGLNEAIILEGIAYWVKKNEANEANYHDGRYWTHNSLPAFERLYPFWTARVVRYSLEKLEKGGYILTGTYNKNPMNHTKWYTLSEKGWALFPKLEEPQNGADKSVTVDNTKLANRQDKNQLPTINTVNIHTVNKQSTRARKEPATVPFDNPSAELLESWKGFVEMRKSSKKPFTARAQKLIASKLEQLAPGDDARKAEILDQSVERGWQGVFQLKDDKPNRSSPKGQQTVQDMTDETMEILRRQGLV